MKQLERREFPGKVGVVVCMDEDLTYGPNVVAFGVAGTAVSHIGEGNQKLFPDLQRQLTEKVRSAMFKALQKVTHLMDLPFMATSHVNCGWAGAQNISAEALADQTAQMCRQLGVDYLGHIPANNVPVETGNSNVRLSLQRDEKIHHHKARRIVVTVGGGITQQELGALEADQYGDAFIISADWLALAIKENPLLAKDVFAFIALEIDIADGIADGIKSASSVGIWNGGRLSHQLMMENLSMVKEMLNFEFPQGKRR